MTEKTLKKPRGHPTAGRAAEIKSDVVVATMKAFADKGSAFSMDEVADLAGVSKQAIYRRWRSKIDLVIEAIETVLGDGLNEPPSPHDDPVAVLEELALRHFGDDQTTSNRLSVYLQAESFRDERLRTRLLDWHFRLVGMFRRSLLDVDAVGRRVPGDIDVQSELLLDLLQGGAQKLALSGSTAKSDQKSCFEQRWEAFKRIAITNA